MLRALLAVTQIVLLASASQACEFPGLAAEADIALQATTGEAIAATLAAAEAPFIEAGRLYAVTLASAEGVVWSVPPKRPPDAGHPFGGVMAWRISSPGRWRIGLSNSAWVDLIVNGVAVASAGHGGDPNCQRPHKVVDFELSGEDAVVIQLSHSADEQLQMSLRLVEPATP